MKRTVKWKESVLWKHLAVFGAVILLIVFLTSIIQLAAMNTARDATYERMNAQTGYYLQLLDNEFSHVRSVQLDFFNDRKLVYIASPRMNITDYEKRDALLSVRERLASISGISSLTGEITLYVPRSEYVITSSEVRRMREQEWDSLEQYYGLENGIFYENEREFFVLENGAAQSKTGEGISYLLVITYPREKIMESVSGLEDGNGGGAFFYSDDYGIIEGEHTERTLAEDILRLLKTDEKGGYVKNQEVTVNREKYLVFSGESHRLGTLIQFAEEQKVMEQVWRLRYYMYGVWAAVAFLALAFIYFTRRTIHKPMEKLLRAFGAVKNGRLDEHIYHDGKDEYAYIYEGFNEMVDQINHLVNEVLQQKNLVQRAELKQLQAQINPHFLYNSFFVLSRRVKRRDYESAEKFAVLLGNYFRFLTRNGSDVTELSAEVEHARCYGEIQGVRFRERISLVFEELPEKYRGVKVPRLILQPLLENSFEHGLENRAEDGILRMSFCEQDNMLLIHVEDNGEELTDERLEQMRESLDGRDNEEITGVVNIHKRLQLYFAGNAGLRLDRSGLGGLDICVWMKIQGRRAAQE